jgi:hypothetical protein
MRKRDLLSNQIRAYHPELSQKKKNTTLSQAKISEPSLKNKQDYTGVT